MNSSVDGEKSFPRALNKEIKMRPNLRSGKIRLRDAQYPAPQKLPNPVRSHSSHLLQIHQGRPTCIEQYPTEHLSIPFKGEEWQHQKLLTNQPKKRSSKPCSGRREKNHGPTI